jgi:hypothetical protein
VTRPRRVQIPIDEVAGDCDDLTLFMNDMVGGKNTSNSPASVSGSGSRNAATDSSGTGGEDLREKDIEGLETIIFAPREAESALPHASIASTIMLPNQDSVAAATTTVDSARPATTQRPAEEPDSTTVKTNSGASTQGSADLAVESSMEAVQGISPSLRLSVQDTAYDESWSLDETPPAIEDVETLKASYREEVEQMKAKHRENLQILSQDLQAQKDKTTSANNRASKGNKELKAIGAQHKDLEEELVATKSEAQQQQDHAVKWQSHQCNEIRQLNDRLQATSQDLVQLEHEKPKVDANAVHYEDEMRKLEADLAQYKGENKQLKQEAFHKANNIEALHVRRHKSLITTDTISISGCSYLVMIITVVCPCVTVEIAGRHNREHLHLLLAQVKVVSLVTHRGK